MKDISKRLQHFIKEKFLTRHRFPISKFSTQSSKFLSTIIELMFESHDLLNTLKIDIQHIKDQDDLPRGYDYNYIPSLIRRELDKMDKNAYLYRFSIKGKDYQVAFIYPLHSIYTESMFQHRINKVIMWLYIAHHFASRRCSQKMNIFMYFTDIEKRLPTLLKSIGQEHANTAFTTSCKTTTEINLYREEEWFKVFIHETFHNLGLDFSELQENLSQRYILSIFPVVSEVNLFECYCEMWAEITNIIFMVFLSLKDKENLGQIPSMLHKIEKHLLYERVFSLFQCVKLIHFFGLDYHTLYDKTSKKSQLSRDHKFKEKRTNVLAYYILKSIYMFYINDFLEWCIEHNKGSLDFNKTPETIHSFGEFIKVHYKEPLFLSYIDIMEKWLQDNNKCDIECSTMRMTLYEE